MAAYYNEHDVYAAQLLRNLITAGHIAPGVVDERSIEDVHPDDLREFTQCHFFAGIGVWSHALRLADWSDDRSVWSGSCPCQPFSAAGKGAGFADERHLWPAWFHLISRCRPDVIFGEQVASRDGLAWLDLVQADLEAADYTSGAFDICAAGVGAPHIRQRLWFVAHSDSQRRREARASGTTVRAGRGGVSGELADASHSGRREERADVGGSRSGDCAQGLPAGPCASVNDLRPGPVNGFWRAADWLGCRDDKWRPAEPGAFPLAHGAPARVGRLRAYGNAIVPQVAAQMISAFMEYRP